LKPWSYIYTFGLFFDYFLWICFEAREEFQYVTPLVARNGALLDWDGKLLYNGKFTEIHVFYIVHSVSINVFLASVGD